MSRPARRRSARPLIAIGGWILACTASPPPHSDGATAPTTAPTTETPKAESDNGAALGPGAWHVGVLSQRGSPDCSSGKEQWVDTQPVIGWISTNPLSDEQAKWLDFPVVAHGKWTEAPSAPATTIKGECPPPQARSDWRFTPRGVRVQRGGGRSGGQHLERDYLQPLVDLTAVANGEEIVVDFRNPLPVALNDVVIRVHYEGCMGKPGTMSREHPVGTLEPRAGAQARLPRLAGRANADPDRPLDHAARSVQIEANGTDATFDLDVSLRILDVKVECPDR